MTFLLLLYLWLLLLFIFLLHWKRSPVQCWMEVVTMDTLKMTTFKARGWHPALCSGGFPYLSDPVTELHDPPSIGSRTLSSPCVMACSRTCSRILGLSLGTTALFAAVANTLLLFPNWNVTYLLRGLIGRHAMLGSGLWGGGLMVSVQGSLKCEFPKCPPGVEKQSQGVGRSFVISWKQVWTNKLIVNL